MTFTKYGLNSEQARVGHIEAQCVCTAAVTKSQGARELNARYSSAVPIYNRFLTYTFISWEENNYIMANIAHWCNCHRRLKWTYSELTRN